MSELVQKLQSATEGSRELDAAIAEFMHAELMAECVPDPEKGAGHWLHPKAGKTFALNYTTNLQDAVSLTDGAYWQVDGNVSPSTATVEIGDDGEVEMIGATPCLALCIAIIKAHEARAEAA